MSSARKLDEFFLAQHSVMEQIRPFAQSIFLQLPSCTTISGLQRPWLSPCLCRSVRREATHNRRSIELRSPSYPPVYLTIGIHDRFCRSRIQAGTRLLFTPGFLHRLSFHALHQLWLVQNHPSPQGPLSQRLPVPAFLFPPLVYVLKSPSPCDLIYQCSLFFP